MKTLPVSDSYLKRNPPYKHLHLGLLGSIQNWENDLEVGGLGHLACSTFLWKP